MAEELPTPIVIINGDDPQDASTSNPQLTLINDPLEDLAERLHWKVLMFLILKHLQKIT